MNDRQSIRAVAELYRVSARTLRYYEEIGLLESHRRDSRYREYDPAQLRRLETILLLRRLSFGLRDIADLLLKDGVGFREALELKVAQSNRQLLEAREVNLLLKRVLSEPAMGPRGALPVADILKSCDYLTQKTERMIPMEMPQEARNRVALGVDLVAEVVDESAGDLIGQVKALRTRLEAQGAALPPVRVYDSPDLEKNQVLVVMDGRETLRKNYRGAEVRQCALDIVEAIASALHP